MGLKASGSKLPARESRLEPGTHIATCSGYIDLGTQDTGFKNDAGEPQIKRRVRINFEILTGDEVVYVGQYYNLSLGSQEKPSNLRTLYKALGGVVPDEDTDVEVDLDSIVGRSCMLDIGHSKPDAHGNVWEKIGKNVVALPSGVPATKLVGEARVYCIQNEQGGVNPIPDWIPEFLRTQICASPEYRDGTPF